MEDVLLSVGDWDRLEACPTGVRRRVEGRGVIFDGQLFRNQTQLLSAAKVVNAASSSDATSERRSVVFMSGLETGKILSGRRKLPPSA